MFVSLPAKRITLLASLAVLVLTVAPTSKPSPQLSSLMFGPNAASVGTIGNSHNWAGYAATNGTFTSVTGTWTVPTISSSGHTAADATWVGIGGITGNDLIQSGTQDIVSSSGQVTASAFFELLPNVSQLISSVTVSGGDSVTVSITQQSTNQWQISFADITRNETYSTTEIYASSLSSAEWIEEAPTDGRSELPLDNFGTVQFSSGSTTENGNGVNLSGANAQAITMINQSNQALATPSALGSDGASFTVTRSSAVSTSANPGFDRYPWGFRRRGVGIGHYYVPPTIPTPNPLPTTPPIPAWVGRPRVDFWGGWFYMMGGRGGR